MSAYSDLLFSLGPSLYWPCDAVGGITDQSGNGRNGSTSGSVTVGGHTATYAPIYNAPQSCTLFDGVDDQLNNTTYSLAVASSTRTLQGWAYRDTSSSNDALVGANTANSGPMLMLVTGTNDVTFRVDQAVAGVTWAGAWPGNTIWVMYAAVFDDAANTVALYINGALVSSQAMATPYHASPGTLRVGVTGGGSFFVGKMAHLAFWESGLTAQNIEDLYAASFQPVIPDTVSAPALA